MKDAGSSGSSSSSSDSDAGAVGPLAGDDDPAEKAAETRKAARKNKGSVSKQTPDEREQEDLKVGAFYQNDGNFRGAYERATDAVSIAGDDGEAQLALADAARRLGKLDEAETHYKKCLTLDPVPKVKKAAEKALAEMSGGM
jgi:Flp pilus assembly protein TadD